MSKDEENWRSGLDMSGQYLYMLEHCLYTDCTFRLGQFELKAHRLIVGRASPVFEAMLLKHEMTEAKTGVIDITDLSQQTLTTIMKYIYSDKITFDSCAEACEICLVADKYQLDSLKLCCLTWIEETLSPSCVWNPLSVAQSLDHQPLIDQCAEILESCTLSCFMSEYIVDAAEDQLVLLLSQDTLSLDGEHTLVLLLERWSRSQAVKRGLAGSDQDVRDVLLPRLLPLLRLVTLTQEQLKYLVNVVGWLSPDDKTKLLSKDIDNFPHYLCKNLQSREWKVETSSDLSVLFPKQSELVLPLTPDSDTVFRNKAYCYGQSFCTFVLRVSDEILMRGIAMRCRKLDRNSQPTCYEENIDAIIGIMDINDEIEELTEAKYKQMTNYDSTINLHFKPAVVLKKDKRYRIQVKTNHYRSTYPVTKENVSEFMFRNINFDVSFEAGAQENILKSFFISTNK